MLPISDSQGDCAVTLPESGACFAVARSQIYWYGNKYSYMERDDGSTPRTLSLPVPCRHVGICQDWLLVMPRVAWPMGADSPALPADALVAVRERDALQERWGNATLALPPVPDGRIAAIRPGKDGMHVVVDTIDGAASILWVDRAPGGEWRAVTVVAPQPGTLRFLPDFSAGDTPLAVRRTTPAGRPDWLELCAANARPMGRAHHLLPQHTLTYRNLDGRSRDGTRVACNVTAPSGQDGPRALQLAVYGGYGHSSTPPTPQSDDAIWLRQGGAMATARVRGGGDCGTAWHLAGIDGGCTRTVEDLEAAVDALILAGISSPGSIILSGISHGGWIALATLLRRPHLYAGAVVLNAPLRARYSTREGGARGMEAHRYTKDIRDALALAPARAIRRRRGGAYPPVLLISAENDSVCPPDESLNVAEIFEMQGHDECYLHVNRDGGHHGAGCTPRSEADLRALTYAFMRHALQVGGAGGLLSECP